MKTLLLATFVSAICLLTSCDKKEDLTTVHTNSQLLGKWNLDRWVSNEVHGSSSLQDSADYNPGDYLQFDANGQCIAGLSGQAYQTTYTLADNDTKLMIADEGSLDLPDDGYQITTLNSNMITLYSKEGAGSDFYEITIYLQK